MTAPERERLERSFDRFEKLPAEEQQALREIEQATAGDESLKSTLQQYERWLNTLSPWERSDLRKADSVEDKLQFVSQITTARRQEAYENQQREAEFVAMVKENLSNFPGQERRPEHVRVSDYELNNMLSVLVTDYGSRVKLADNTLPGCVAYNMQLLAEALKASIQQKGLEKAREKPLSDEIMREMLDRITDSKAREAVEERNKDTRSFAGYLAWKLEWAWWNEARENPPSQAEIDKIAETLGSKILEEYQRRKEDDPRRAYFYLLMATRPATFKSDKRELDDVLDELGLKRSRYRPTGPGAPKNGGPPNGSRGGQGPPRGDNDDPGRDRDRSPPRPKEPEDPPEDESE
jgi:hypothetical protein